MLTTQAPPWLIRAFQSFQISPRGTSRHLADRALFPGRTDRRRHVGLGAGRLFDHGLASLAVLDWDLDGGERLGPLLIHHVPRPEADQVLLSELSSASPALIWLPDPGEFCFVAGGCS